MALCPGFTLTALWLKLKALLPEIFTVTKVVAQYVVPVWQTVTVLVPAESPMMFRRDPLMIALTDVGLVFPETVKVFVPLLAKILTAWLWPIDTVGLLLPRVTPVELCVFEDPLIETKTLPQLPVP